MKIEHECLSVVKVVDIDRLSSKIKFKISMFNVYKLSTILLRGNSSVASKIQTSKQMEKFFCLKIKVNMA